MCKCLATQVACCCCSCAMSIVISVLFIVVIAAAIATVAVYFGVLKVEDDSSLDKLSHQLGNAVDKVSETIKNHRND